MTRLSSNGRIIYEETAHKRPPPTPPVISLMTILVSYCVLMEAWWAAMSGRR
jgi:hypothetical protein